MLQFNNSRMQTTQVIDERQPLERFNRISLYYLMKTCGFDVVDSMPKERMLKLAEAHPERVDFNKVQTYLDGFGGVRVVRPDKIKGEEKAAAEVHVEEKKGYEGKTKKELMTEGKELGLSFDYKMKPEDMVAAIMLKKSVKE